MQHVSLISAETTLNLNKFEVFVKKLSVFNFTLKFSQSVKHKNWHERLSGNLGQTFSKHKYGNIEMKASRADGRKCFSGSKLNQKKWDCCLKKKFLPLPTTL